MSAASRCSREARDPDGVRLERSGSDAPDLGDFVILLLASTLAGLRDRLSADGFAQPADLVADLVDITDDYLTRVIS